MSSENENTKEGVKPRNWLVEQLTSLFEALAGIPVDEPCPAETGADIKTTGAVPAWFHPDRVREVVELYVQGMAVDDISHWVGLSRDEVNMVLDHYAPHLEGI